MQDKLSDGCVISAIFLTARMYYENLAKNKPAWGLRLTENENIEITDANDNPSVLVKGNSGPGWAFVAVDLETIMNIRVWMAVCKYNNIYHSIIWSTHIFFGNLYFPLKTSCTLLQEGLFIGTWWYWVLHTENHAITMCWITMLLIHECFIWIVFSSDAGVLIRFNFT